jgi:hypothetical protein
MYLYIPTLKEMYLAFIYFPLWLKIIVIICMLINIYTLVKLCSETWLMPKVKI